MAEYRPGTCNIGEAERRRSALGALAAAATLALVVGVLGTGAPAWLLLAAAVPLFGAAQGYLQARHEFCVAFGLAGVYDTGEGRAPVADPDDRAADRQAAGRLTLRAAGLAAVGTALVYAVGLLVG